METLKAVLEAQLKAIKEDLIDLSENEVKALTNLSEVQAKIKEANKMARDIQKKLEKLK